MITQLFPTDFFVKVRPPNLEEIFSKVSSIEVDIDSIQKREWSANCTVKTINLDQSEWVPLLTPGVQDFFKQVGFWGTINIEKPWINFYKRGYFQEVHHHSANNSSFSSVLFLNSGRDYARFYFQNRMCGYIPPLIEKLANISDFWYPDVEPGDMLFFPSYLLHGVSPHCSDEIRKTLSFNIECIDHVF